MRTLALWTSVVVVSLAPGCGGEDEEPTLFSAADAEGYLQEWAAALAKQDVDVMVARSGVPFRFRTRTWTSTKELKANLGTQIAALKAQMEKASRDGGSFEYFSHRDLKDGRFPERAEVAEDLRDAAITRLGVRPDGFVAWLRVGRQSVLKIVLNPPSARDRLVVQGIDPR